MTSATTIDQQNLQIHVFGSSKGESVVVGLPGGGWGIVDCYAGIANDPATNPALKFVEDRGIKELEFLCLTHPHDDHYRGMLTLWDSLKVKFFWRFGGLDANTAKKLMNYLGLMEKHETGSIESTTELAKILAKLKRNTRGRNGPSHAKQVASKMQVYPQSLDRSADCQIWGIAPSGDNQENYSHGLLSFMSEKGKPLNKLPHSHHNIISVGLVIEWGATRVVLGGDIEEKGWRHALAECRELLTNVTAVKVSHHGSTNGYCSELWPTLGGIQCKCAIVTRYRGSKLPDPIALTHIRQYCEKLYVLGQGAIGTDDDRRGPFRKSAPMQFSRLSVTLDRNNQCIDFSSDGPIESI